MNRSPAFSDLMLERYNLGEVLPREAGEIEAVLEQDGETAQRLAAIRLSDLEIRSRFPENRAAFSGGRMRPFRGTGWPGYRRIFLGACAAALVCALTLPFLLNPAGDAPAEPAERSKGSAELSVFLKTDNSILRDRAVLHEGSTIQLAYRVERPCYGVIFSIDGRSSVTLHYPYRTGGNTALTPGGRIALEEAYILDDAPDFEIFFFVISDKPLDAAMVLERAGRLAGNPHAALSLGPEMFAGYELKYFFLKKD